MGAWILFKKTTHKNVFYFYFLLKKEGDHLFEAHIPLQKILFFPHAQAALHTVIFSKRRKIKSQLVQSQRGIEKKDVLKKEKNKNKNKIQVLK